MEEETKRPKLISEASKRKPRQKLDDKQIAYIVEQHLKGQRNIQIAREMNISRSAITAVLKKFEPVFKELPNVPDFQAIKADVIDAATLKALKSAVSQEKHDEARLGEVAKMLDVLYKAGRLERGQSTSNVATSFVSLTPTKLVEDSSD